jgi:4-hydroxybenzoate polyprenyltransferase
VQAGVIAFYCLALTLWGLAFWLLRHDWFALLALVPAGLHLLWQGLTLDRASGESALARFRANRMAGALVGAACFVVGNA